MSKSKRRAGSELNHENWNDEDDEPEEKGEFRKASEDEMRQRVIKTAKRRLNSSSSGGSSVFSGFQGFGSSNNGSSGAKTTASIFSFLNNTSSSGTSTENVEKKPAETKTNNGDDSKSKTYFQKLRALNEGFSGWIKQHVDKDPICILTPILKDYERYLKEIDEEKKEEAVKSEEEKPEKSTIFKGFSFAASQTKPDSVQGSPTASVTSTVPSVISTGLSAASSFGIANSQANSLTGTTSGFSFGSSAAKPFTFGSAVSNPTPPKDNSEAKTEENDEDEPPKVEFKPVVEEDNVFSKRCKLFFKVDGSFKDRGIGTIFIKPVQDGAKHQLIVRADTSLGNILANFILSNGLPVQKMGANNVMVVCIPNTDFDKPTSVLFKVKTAEDADDLHANLKKYLGKE